MWCGKKIIIIKKIGKPTLVVCKKFIHCTKIKKVTKAQGGRTIYIYCIGMCIVYRLLCNVKEK